MSNVSSYKDLVEGRNHQMPNQLLNAAFGELNITKNKDRLEVTLTVLVDPSQSSKAEGWQTGVALDGSRSMRANFGEEGLEWTRGVSADEQNAWQAKGYGILRDVDGARLFELSTAGLEAVERDGLLRRIKCDNKVQALAQEAIPYLADKLDEDGGTTVIYWACGERGDRVEVLGDFTGEEAGVANYNGPSAWGEGTYLMPAIRYFLDRFKDAKMGFYVFVTDGAINDFEEVKKFTAQLSHDMADGKCNEVKLVLIGVGSQINRKQLEELDDLPDELDLPVDVWDHKISAEMRGLSDIFAELVDENMILAPSGRILDSAGNVVKEYTDGLPAMLKFELLLNSTSFSLEIAGGNVVRQDLYGSSATPPPLPS